MPANKALNSFLADLRQANPGMTPDQLAEAARAQLQEALSAPPAVRQHAESRPTGARAQADVPLAK